MIHVYTGDGQGKTTAAMGLALRAAGHGLPVVVVQFLKGGETGEITALSSLPGVTVLRCRKEYGFWPSLTDEERRAVTAEHDSNLSRAIGLTQEGLCAMLVLDEACAAYALGAVDRKLFDKLFSCCGGIELILTGRSAPECFLEKADYISEIKCVRHPLTGGTPARMGVEF